MADGLMVEPTTSGYESGAVRLTTSHRHPPRVLDLPCGAARVSSDRARAAVFCGVVVTDLVTTHISTYSEVM